MDDGPSTCAEQSRPSRLGFGLDNHLARDPGADEHAIVVSSPASKLELSSWLETGISPGMRCADLGLAAYADQEKIEPGRRSFMR
jgi:hypothetical protein